MKTEHLRSHHLLSSAISVWLILLVLATTVFAAIDQSWEITIGEASFTLTAKASSGTYVANSFMQNDNVITLQAKGYDTTSWGQTCSNKDTVTFTLTNTTVQADEDKTPRAVKYTVSVNGGTATEYDNTVATFTAETGNGASSAGTITIAITVVELESSNVPLMTTIRNMPGGTVTVNNTLQKDAEQNYTNDSGTEYTLIADADDKYEFYGWQSSNGLLSNEATYKYTPTSSSTVWPLFIKSGSAVYYVQNETPRNYYGYLDNAITAARNSGTIVVCKSGTAYHSDSTKTSFTIPKGVTLLLPYSATDTTIQSGLTSGADYLANGNYAFNASGGEQAPNSSVTYTLTIPSGTTLSVANGTATTVGNCGRIVVGGKIASGNGTTLFNGATYKDHSNLVIDGTLDLGDYAVLAATGYVLGNGQINAEGTGAQIFQPYVVMDFPGAAVAAMAMREGGISGSTQPSGEAEVSPYIYWGVVNIQTNLKMKSGNFMYAFATLGDDDNPYHTNAVLVGNSGTKGLLTLDSDATFYNDFESITWSDYDYGLLGRNKIRIEGGASLGSLQLSLNAGWISADIDTATVTVGLGYNMDITLEKGDDYYVDMSMMLLPGSGLTVAEDATLTIGSKASNATRFAIWDGLIHRGYRKSASSQGEYQVASATTRYKSVNYPTNAELDKGGLSEDAEFIIDGKLVIGAKAVIGGIIQTNGGGTVEVNSSATPSVKVQANILDLQHFNFNYRYMASMSMMDSAAKLNLNGALTSITAGTTYYGVHNNTLTNSGFTNIYYPGFDSSANRVAAEDLDITYNSAETIKGSWSTIAPVQIMGLTNSPVPYASLNKAMAAYTGAAGEYIRLNTECPVYNDGGALIGDATMTKHTYLDLNGCSIEGDISGTYTNADNTIGKYTLYGMDTGTNGYEDNEAGKIVGTISGTVAAKYTADRSTNNGKHYLTVSPTANNVQTTQFHRVGLSVNAFGYDKAKNYITVEGTFRGSEAVFGKLTNPAGLGFNFDSTLGDKKQHLYGGVLTNEEGAEYTKKTEEGAEDTKETYEAGTRIPIQFTFDAGTYKVGMAAIFDTAEISSAAHQIKIN